ncbi:DNA-binding transcriptional regulator, XRE-family HTH domain [Methylobacterium sp. 174MFSha1.1]|uniref:helix-turn-helix transcriptional regulator n=1 Tax=Methylobacterium sp. 174MFSha1.1 TaxID=1502749 RepID=UPI0008EBEC75|nr:helix-turn-helix transcriptional regulator [Methylobacterium sp. 174MFSha1.1]SFV03727.1 DNA-binding transcriptional regulator, XRE-family HTH domain [Methylobacterium sp. 174MFSha1.1]
MTIVRTKTPAGEAIVILPEAEFERLRDLAEEAADACTLAASLARLQAGEEELLSGDDLDALRAAPTPLAFWRGKRGLSPEELARHAGVPEERLGTVERGESIGDVQLYRRLARALGVEIEDLVPDAP